MRRRALTGNAADVIHPVSTGGFLARVEPDKVLRWRLAKHFSMKAHARILSMFNHNSSQDKSYSDYHKASSDQSSGSSE
jgi:hypothetical protein